MCYACGQMLRGDEAKCPSCGAPVQHLQASLRRSGRLTVAAALFLGLSLITITVAGYYLFDTAALGENTSTLGGIAFAVTGTVHYANGTAAPWTAVRLDGQPNGTASDANGTYTLHGVPVGVHVVHFTNPNTSALDVRVFVTSDERVDAVLPGGSSAVAVRDNSYQTWIRVVNVCGGLLIGIALLQFAGAVASFRRRSYGLALVAAWFGLVELVAFLPAVLVSFIVIVLVVRSKNEFR